MSLGEGSQVVEFNNAQLVVGLTAVSLVTQELEDLGLPVEGAEQDETLELALITFSGLDGWKIPEDYLASVDLELDKYDQLVGCLRWRFAKRLAGWSPALGKNRLIGSVGTAGPANGVVSGGHANPYANHANYVANSVVPRGAGRPTPVPAGSTKYSIGPSGAGEHCRVAILDTRLTDRPELLGKVLASGDSYLPAGSTEPLDFCEGHATFVTGLIVAEAPAAALQVQAVLIGDGSTCTAWDLARAMARLAEGDIDVLNLSLGCFTADDQPPFVLQRAVDLLRPRTVIVAAAGNHGGESNSPGSGRGACIDGRPRPFWPAALDTVIAIGASDGDATAEFSPKAVWVDLEAPGVNVTSLYLSGPVDGNEINSSGKYTGNRKLIGDFTGYARWSGTSAAAATVTGIIAAALKQGKTAAQVVQEMRAGKIDRVRPT